MTNTAPRLLLDKPDAADVLAISPRTLDRLIRDGEIETVKLGHRRLVPYAACEDYVEKLRRSA